MRRVSTLPALIVLSGALACNQPPNPADIACSGEKINVSLGFSAWPKIYGDAGNRSIASGPGPTIGNDVFSVPLAGTARAMVLGESAARTYLALGADGLTAYDGQVLAWNQPGSFSVAPVVGAGGGVFAVDDGGTVQSLDPDSGARRWAQTVTGNAVGGLTIAPGNRLVVTTSQGVTVFSTLGAFRWSSPIPGGVAGIPAVGHDGDLLVADGSGSLTAFDDHGTQAWHYTGSGGLRAPPVVDAACNTYLVTSTSLTSIEPKGLVRWTLTLPGAPSGAPVLAADGSLYLIAGGQLQRVTSVGTIQPRNDVGDAAMTLIDGAGRLIVVDAAGSIAAIDEPGALRWTYSAGAAVGAAALTGDGGLLIATDDDQLIRVE